MRASARGINGAALRAAGAATSNWNRPVQLLVIPAPVNQQHKAGHPSEPPRIIRRAATPRVLRLPEVMNEVKHKTDVTVAR